MEIEHSLKNKEAKDLYQTLANFKNTKDLSEFLRDLCTIEELTEMINRWQVAQMINKKMSYRAIAKKTGLSTTTISRVAYWLNHGTGGYNKALKQNEK